MNRNLSLAGLVEQIVRVGRIYMKFVLGAVTAALLLATQTVTADAKGCIKGAVVGGAAGHMVGHGKMGAAAGCVVGHHNANKKQRQSKSKSNRTAQAINLDHQKRRGRA
jgi:uncharacterized protein YcfJ